MQEINLKDKELDRIIIIKQVIARQLTQIDAAQNLNLSERQVRRLQRTMEQEGVLGIKAKYRCGNRLLCPEFKKQVMARILERYHDFGPTFAAEKLQNEGFTLSKETLRKWMIEAGLWKGRSRKQARIHQGRDRRSRFGELVQIDGSHHDWFEGRAPKCCLLVFIDDATSKIIGLYFDNGETTLGYMRLIKNHITSYGRPIAYYSDKHSIFKTTRSENIDGIHIDTQLKRSLKELNIELICAHSSQAKGRVERANQTLQDRLIKEMRLQGISNIEEANTFLPGFIKGYNNKFSVCPASVDDAHRFNIKSDVELNRILSMQHSRKLSKNLELSYEGTIYQIQTKQIGYGLRYKSVTICKAIDGSMEIWDGNRKFEYKTLKVANKILEADAKEINVVVDALVAANTNLMIQGALCTSPQAQTQLSS